MGFNIPVDPAAALYSYKALGNAMTVASVGGVLGCALACLRPIDEGLAWKASQDKMFQAGDPDVPRD